MSNVTGPSLGSLLSTAGDLNTRMHKALTQAVDDWKPADGSTIFGRHNQDLSRVGTDLHDAADAANELQRTLEQARGAAHDARDSAAEQRITRALDDAKRAQQHIASATAGYEAYVTADAEYSRRWDHLHDTLAATLDEFTSMLGGTPSPGEETERALRADEDAYDQMSGGVYDARDASWDLTDHLRG